MLSTMARHVDVMASALISEIAFKIGDTARHPVVHVAIYLGTLELFQSWSVPLSLSFFPSFIIGITIQQPGGPPPSRGESPG